MTLKNHPKKINAGLTILEVLLAVSITVLIMLVMTMFARNIWIYNSFLGSSLTSLNAGRNTLKTMVAEIRTASSGNDGSYPVALATATGLTVYSDIYPNGANVKEKVRYFLEGTNFKRGVIIPTGSPLAYTGAEVITTLIPNVTNATIFDYYDKNYDGTSAPLSLPVNIPSVRLVKITIIVDDDPNKAPGPITLSSQVTLRNIKDNL